MSILIRGMKLPKSCAFCKLKRRNGKKMVCPLLNEEWDIRDPMSADFKLNNCPLVPVPPHGRLIDADDFFKALTMDDRVTIIEAMHVQSILSDAPTIVPAEHEEEKMK